MTYQKIISKWNLNRVTLASKMNMPGSTFKNKLSEIQSAYHFTEAEEQKLLGILRELATDIGTVGGASLNDALDGLVKKKV